MSMFGFKPYIRIFRTEQKQSQTPRTARSPGTPNYLRWQSQIVTSTTKTLSCNIQLQYLTRTRPSQLV